MKYLNELKNLKLPAGKFAIFGSGPLAIRKIRESRDLDIVVKSDLWEELLARFPDSLCPNQYCLSIGNIDICRNWPQSPASINKMIATAEMIEDLPFVRLQYVIAWKEKSARDKDLRDLELIKKYLANLK